MKRKKKLYIRELAKDRKKQGRKRQEWKYENF